MQDEYSNALIASLQDKVSQFDVGTPERKEALIKLQAAYRDRKATKLITQNIDQAQGSDYFKTIIDSFTKGSSNPNMNAEKIYR